MTFRPLLFVVTTTLTLAQAPSTIDDFRKYVGQTQTICGRVVTYDYPGKAGSGDCQLRLDMGQPSWNPVFYALINPGPGLVPAPEPFLSSRVCVTGLVSSDPKHVPFIAVSDASLVQLADKEPAPQFGAGAVRACEAGVTAPKLAKEVRPNYPADEFHKRAVGDRSPVVVFLQALVGADGRVTACRTGYAPSASFRDAAEKAVKQWRFAPATRNGSAVPVIVEVQMTFNF